jgi:hypothetical protein
MTFEKNSLINLIVDEDIKKIPILHNALLAALNQWELAIGNNITFGKQIKYIQLGIDESAKDNALAAVMAWTDRKKNFHSQPANHNSIMVVLENKGATATGTHENTNGIITGMLILPRTRLLNATYNEQIDLISHELGHCFDIPHVQDPWSIEGFFDNQATMFNQTIFDPSLKIFNANMDPISSDIANGLQESDKHLIRYFYPQEIPGNIKVKFATDLVAVNLALLGRSRKAPLSKSVAMPSINGEINFYIPTGEYSLYLRKSSQKGGKLSGVFGEPGPSSFSDGGVEYWFRKKSGNKLIFQVPTKPAHRLVKLKINKSNEYSIILRN